MNDYKEELLPLAFNKAKAIKNKIVELGLTSSITDDDKEQLIIELAKAKSDSSGKPWTSHLSGMEWYVNDLLVKSELSSKELLEICYKELLPSNSTFDELTRMLEEE